MAKDDKEIPGNYGEVMNPNNNEYWISRGLPERPEDWEDRAE